MSPEQQQMKGCTGVMLYFMPLFSLYISFVVPGAVGIYWTFSNMFAILQSYVLNRMYNPGKIRAQAEIEYQERRARRAAEKAEEKRRLAEARQREEELEAKYAQMEAEGKTIEPKEEKSDSIFFMVMPQGVKKDKKPKKEKKTEETTPDGDTKK
jgi:YidC/Oxa1 family membrane protein insertase